MDETVVQLSSSNFFKVLDLFFANLLRSTPVYILCMRVAPLYVLSIMKFFITYKKFKK